MESPSLAQPRKSYGLHLSVPGHNSKAKLQGTSPASLTFLMNAFCKTESSYTQSMPPEKQYASKIVHHDLASDFLSKKVPLLKQDAESRIIRICSKVFHVLSIS